MEIAFLMGCNAFALSGRVEMWRIYPGCYPGLCASALSGRNFTQAEAVGERACAVVGGMF